MEKNFISFMKYSLVAFALVGLVFTTGCNDDEGADVNPLVGTYILSNATLASALTITLTGAQEPLELPAGTDVTELIFGILAAASPCTNPANATIELGEDGTFFYACTGEGAEPVDSGSWSEDSEAGTITLTIASVALNTTITVFVENYVISGNSFSGLIQGFPVPIDANVDFGAPIPGTEPPVVNFQLASINATFTKLP